MRTVASTRVGALGMAGKALMKRTAVACLSAGLMAPALAGAEITDGVIKIGMLSDVVGTYSQSSGQGAQVAAELAAEDFGGTINGKRIQILLGDTKNKPDEALKVLEEWLKEGVDLVTDMPSSAVAVAVQNRLKDTDVVVIHNGAGTELLTGKLCNDHSLQWQYNTGAFSSGAGFLAEQMKGGKWFVITLDHPFGRGIYNDVEKAITPHGGKIVGSVFHGFSETNFFPIIQKAMDSGADVIAFGNAGKGLTEAIRQSKELGVAVQGKEVVSIMTLMQDIRGVGLYAAAGMRFVSPYYWNINDGSRKFSERFKKRMGQVPSEAQIANYASTLHYLKAVQETGSDRGSVVVDAMKRIKIDDGITQNGYIREDGRVVHDMNFMQVKRPIESTEAMDYFTRVGVIPGDKAFAPPTTECPLIK